MISGTSPAVTDQDAGSCGCLAFIEHELARKGAGAGSIGYEFSFQGSHRRVLRKVRVCLIITRRPSASIFGREADTPGVCFGPNAAAAGTPGSNPLGYVRNAA